MDRSLKLVFISFFTLFISATIRILVQLQPLPISHNFCIVLLGMAFGYVNSVYPEIGFNNLTNINPQIIMNIVVPVMMFEASFFTNLESFIIAGVQVALLVFLIFCLSIGVVGLFIIYIFNYGWGWNQAIILTSIIITPGPIVTMTFLKRLVASLRLQYFLESEAIIGNCLAFIVYKFCILWSLSETLYIKEYIIGLCVSPFLGFIIAKVIAYWMSKIIKDSVNQVCIVIASLYACYLLAEISRMCGMIAVVFMGMFMTGRRSNMSENTEKILLRLLHVMSNYFNCNLIMLSSIKLSLVLHLLTWEDCANIAQVFILTNLIRILVVLLLCPMLKDKGYCLSLNSLLVLAVCNIRGAITILLAFSLLYENFKIPNEVKMFTLAITQVVLSLLFNATIANGVIRYDVFDESKAQFIANTHAMLREIQMDSIFMMKHNNKYMADADWSVVEKYTTIQHPLLNMTAKIDEVHPHSKRKIKAMERQAIYRILMMMKCSYWKQYGEGILSRNAVKQLMHWSSEALARGNTLIFPSKIQSTLTVPKLYQHLKQDVWNKLQDWSNMGTQSKYLQVLFGGMVIILHFVDLNLTLVQLSNDIFMFDHDRESILFWYNLTYILCHVLLCMFRVTIQKKVSIWEFLIVLLVVIGSIDLLVWTRFQSTPLLKFLHLLLIATRFFRILRVVEVLPFVLKFVLEICELNINLLLAEGFDIARSYVRARLEVLRLLTHAEQDIPKHILKKFKDVCIQHKLETSKMLGYLQIKHPVIAASAKMRQAVRIVLTKELAVLEDLEKIRMMRHKDGTILEKVVMTQLINFLSKWVTVMPPSHESIIASVSWIQNNPRIFNLILQKGKVVQYKRSEHIVTQSSMPGGLFIILHGIAVLSRKVKDITDAYTEQTMGYITTGSVIGEFTFLTGKPRHKAVICETNLTVLYVKSKHMWQFMGGKPSVHRLKLSTLEEQIWKAVAIKLAYRLLILEADWMMLSQSEIIGKLVDGVLVDGQANPQAFAHYIQTSDIILIYGKLVDQASNEVIAGPVFVPKGHIRFSLTAFGKIRPILFILPTSNEDRNQFCRFKTKWDLCTATGSDVTLSSGGSSSRPSLVPRDLYFGSSGITETSQISGLGTLESFGFETEV